jgi:hypothetical protein
MTTLTNDSVKLASKPKPASSTDSEVEVRKEWPITRRLGLLSAFLIALTLVLSQVEPAVEAAVKACKAFGGCNFEYPQQKLSCDDYSKLSAEEIGICQKQ